MKAQDLMIGDWVEFPPGKDTVQEITYVCGRGYCVSFAASATLFQYPIAEVVSIPLSAEILEKNGFDMMVFDNGDKLFAYGSLCILEHKGILTFKISDCRKIINYVHELQHALKLCGIGKTIEL